MENLTIDARPILIRASAVIDAAGTSCAPGAVLVDEGRVVAAGDPAAIGMPDGVLVQDCPDAVLVPGLVNAHTHLDLTLVGPRPYSGSFTDWISLVRAERPVDDGAIADAVRAGIELSAAGGTAALGDIAGVGSLIPGGVMDDAGVRGVSYVEFFGIGDRAAAAVEAIEALVAAPPAWSTVRFGLQPHAPYSCADSVFRAAAAQALPVATHLAETVAEMEFLAAGTGQFAAMLESFGISDALGAGSGSEPVRDVAALLDGPGPRLAVHLNHATEADAAALRASGVSVVVCPRASRYFGEPGGPHPLRVLHDAGVNVALGTDSIIGQDRHDRMSVLDEIPLVDVDAMTALELVTVNGAVALGLDSRDFTFARGAACSVLALELPAGVTGSASALLAAGFRHGVCEWVVPP